MFTQEQINELLANKNVSKCSAKSITYDSQFKVKAVKSHLEEGLSPRKIFKQAGFDLNIIGANKPDDSIYRWRKIYNDKGEKGLIIENRGGTGRRKKILFETKDEEIEYLKTKIAYMDAENDFLAKLRGLKRE